MNEREWKRMQDELKQLQPDREDAPQDAYRFKQRVLAEYEGRTRLESHARWARRAAAALTVCAAVCVGLFVAPPILSNQQPVQRSAGKEDRSTTSQPAAFTYVKYDARLPVAPAGGLAVTDQLPPDVALPQEKQIDPHQEVGLYVLNGSVDSFALGSQDIKLHVRHDPGRVQVLTIPLSMLQTYAGASFEVNTYDEDGKRLESRVMKIPTKK